MPDITGVSQKSSPTKGTGNNGPPVSQALPFFHGGGVCRKGPTARSLSPWEESRGRKESWEGTVTQ